MSHAADVFVVLSTYNGEKYLEAQLDSLLAQSFAKWSLLVRDDGSSDRTREIVDRYARADTRITQLLLDSQRLGPWASFGILLQAALDRGANYVFMCDQDDVWEPDKVATELSLLKKAEEHLGVACPLLVHSDLAVVDCELEPVHRSFRVYQGVSYDRADPLGTLLLHNAVVGCTVGVNRALLEISLPLPAGAYHDWWLAQCAAASGRLLDIEGPTVRYRHHSANVGGAPGRRAALYTVARTPMRFLSSFMMQFNAGLVQVANLETRLRVRLAEKASLERIARYLAAFDPQTNYLRRLAALWRSGVRPRRKVSYVFLALIMLMFPGWKRSRVVGGID